MQIGAKAAVEEKRPGDVALTHLIVELVRMLRCSWIGRWAWGLILIGAIAHGASAQSMEDNLRQRLIEKPLYLRGFWASDRLEFDSNGKLKSKSDLDPFTLCGIDVLHVKVSGKEIKIDGRRVGLVSDGGGRMKRKPIQSTTIIVPSLRRDNTFKAGEEISIKISGDGSGNFDAALKAIFVDGLHELAGIVPPYWMCYAHGYFENDNDVDTAEEIVKACVEKKSLAPKYPNDDQLEMRPPKIISPLSPNFGERFAELEASGISEIAFTISAHGIPLGFQVVKAVGGGADEALLLAASRAQYEPGTRGGTPISSTYKVSISINTQEH